MTTALIQISGICRSSFTSPYSSVRTRFCTVGGASALGRCQPTEGDSGDRGERRGDKREEGRMGGGG